ncbi:hypothetical protein A2U01_0049236 [Trifolium medium]|uniref:Uncharacterized protein n=1 Tax=Trifolium medium TaxID=97028 RepID=A0A392QWY4_9FABA|nr:hypothetical protein [Trifolium medium]
MKSHDCHKGQSFRCRALRFAENACSDEKGSASLGLCVVGLSLAYARHDYACARRIEPLGPVQNSA